MAKIEYSYQKTYNLHEIQSILDYHGSMGFRLKTVTIADLWLRTEFIFVKNPDEPGRYQYAFVYCYQSTKVEENLHYYANIGFQLVAHVMSDLGMRHDLYFEKKLMN